MLSLVAIWQAMQQVKRKIIWLLLASLAFGLAIASRPNLLYGAMILFLPLICEWRNSTKPSAVRKLGPLFLATAFPLALIGAGLMIYNFLRFGNVFEFGWQYCSGSGMSYQASRNGMGQFGLRYFWYNFYYYFLEPMRWAAHFPFLQTYEPPAPPFGHGAANEDCGGILLVHYPLALAALAAALVWRRKEGNQTSAVALVCDHCFASFRLFGLRPLSILHLPVPLRVGLFAGINDFVRDWNFQS